jgi:DNA-directed RNA polymerase specialized sigma subunit
MWKIYRTLVRQYPKVSISEERELIFKAQNGSKKSKDELVLRHIGFLIFRIYKKVFPHLIPRFGEDLLAEAILIVYNKINSYDLEYCDKQRNPRPVRFSSYLWKRIDGFILDSLKREMKEMPYGGDFVADVPLEAEDNL